jgi:hypothetical protein
MATRDQRAPTWPACQQSGPPRRAASKGVLRHRPDASPTAGMLWGALTDRVRQSGSSPPVVRGWMTYCGKFYRTDLGSMLRRINAYLMR